MSIYPHAVEALADAKVLADMGVPIFTARLKPNGDPIPPNGWEKTRPSSAPANRYRASNTSGLCALTGILYDVIDIDPRNGGDKSIQRLSSELGDNGPEVYWRVKTPSGGQHLYIACLGIGSHNGFMPGLDLKGGKKDGSSRGFVFLPPTVRPSKVTGKPSAYQRIGDGPSDADTVRCSALADFIEKQISERNSSSAGGAFRRNEPSSLRQACLDAEAGEQREALLRYVHELERRGYEDSDIVTVILGLTMEMPTYDVNRPWTERHIRGLLHHSGRVLPDALPDELAGIEGPITAGLVQNMAGLEPERVSWIWRKYLAFRELTLLDGEKGQGKSFIVDDWASIASRGDCFPGSPDEKIDPINVIIFTDEGHLESTTLPRLIAANANRDRIYTPRIKKPKRGKVEVWDLALPDGAVIMERMIKEAGAQLAIWDPITDFLDESVNSHNDASVRRALRPLNGILNRTNCAGLAIRHLNKNTQQEARFRGGGSVAFANRARVHLIAAKLPVGASPEGGMFGVGMLEVNIAKKIDDVLAYSITDSHVFADDAGNAVGRVEWHGYCGVKAEDLGKQHAAKGPTPVVQDEIISVLNQMFSERDVWDADEAKRALTDAGINANKETVVKARKRVGIIARARFINGRIDGWDWKIQAKESTNKRGAPR